MTRGRLHCRIMAGVLLLAAARTWFRSLETPPTDLLDPRTGPPAAIPDLATDDWVRLTWLPGIGPARARSIVALRPFLGAPLTPGRLRLLPGFGATGVAEIQAWYARGGAGPQPPP